MLEWGQTLADRLISIIVTERIVLDMDVTGILRRFVSFDFVGLKFRFRNSFHMMNVSLTSSSSDD